MSVAELTANPEVSRTGTLWRNLPADAVATKLGVDHPIGAALVLTFLVTALSPLQRIFDTVPLTSAQWGICLLGPLVFLAVTELGKLLERQADTEAPMAVPAGV